MSDTMQVGKPNEDNSTNGMERERRTTVRESNALNGTL
jgi:hypothetical protein